MKSKNKFLLATFTGYGQLFRLLIFLNAKFFLPPHEDETKPNVYIWLDRDLVIREVLFCLKKSF